MAGLELQQADLERRLIGGCLMRDKPVLDYIVAQLQKTDFTEPDYQAIFDAVIEAVIAGEMPNRVNVMQHLLRLNLNTAAERLVALNIPVTWEQYNTSAARTDCRQMRDSSLRCRLVRIGNEIAATAAQRNGQTADEILHGLYGSMLGLLSNRQSTAEMNLSAAFDRTQIMQDDFKASNYYSRLKTGFPILDSMYQISPGKVTVLGGYTSHGKSALALCIANNLIHAGIPVLYVSIEMDYADIAYRLAAMNSQVALSSLTHGHIPKLRQIAGMEKLADMMPLFHIVDLDAATEVEIVLHMQQHMVKYPDTGMIFIDYIQNVDSERNPKLSRHLQVSTIARYFRAAAKRLRVPVTVLSQLARPEKRDGKFRMATEFDLKESGDIETSADAVLLINRLDSDSCDWYAILELKKQRQGQRGIVDMRFEGRHVRFEEEPVPPDILEKMKIKRGG